MLTTVETTPLPVCMTITEFRRQYGAGCSKSFVYNQMNDGRLKTVKVGRKRLIRRVDAESWLNSRSEA